MKALAASNIGQYDNAVRALTDYDRTVELGLVAIFQQGGGLDFGVNQVERMDKRCDRSNNFRLGPGTCR